MKEAQEVERGDRPEQQDVAVEKGGLKAIQGLQKDGRQPASRSCICNVVYFPLHIYIMLIMYL